MENNTRILMNMNPVVAYLQKAPKDFTMEDIIKLIKFKSIQMVNFIYPGGDGKLKTLNFVITNEAYLRTILSCGERVDGSSLFDFIQASSSDLYVMPRFSTAFIDPFAEIPTLCMLCSFFDKDGHPLESAPEYTLRKAITTLRDRRGWTSGRWVNWNTTSSSLLWTLSPPKSSMATTKVHLMPRQETSVRGV